LGYEQDYMLEYQHFQQIEKQIEKQLEDATHDRAQKQETLIQSRRDMWENTSHSSDDFDRVIEISQYLSPLASETYSAVAAQNRVDALEKMTVSPYFARIDFKRDEDKEPEPYYVGRFGLMDEKTHTSYVHDWRAPVSSLFYRHGVGHACYDAPAGKIEGVLTLKRQYEIKNGQFEYFFDADVQIVDEFLRKMLAKNTSSKMKTIVETIQKDQDEVIRDNKNQLLMVQGVAGSGKTSIALHRVAYLMYEGLARRLNANNIIVISPNTLFEQYISDVLPELGEHDVSSLVFLDLLHTVLRTGTAKIQPKYQEIETILTCENPDSKELQKASVAFKASPAFATILKRYAQDIPCKWIPFHDVVYCGQTVFTGGELHKMMLELGEDRLLSLNLQSIEETILEVIRKMRVPRLAELEKEAGEYPEHMYDWKEFARMNSIAESTELICDIRTYTRFDCLALYRNLFRDRAYFDSLTEGILLPERMDEIFEITQTGLQEPTLPYQDAVALTFLHLLLTPCTEYKDIRQVVVDEAQDYDPMHFEIMKRLFVKSRYTILGDINQTIENRTDISLYTQIQDVLQKEHAYLATLNQSFRSTNEILQYSSRFIDLATPIESVGRSGDEPAVTGTSTRAEYLAALENEVAYCRELGYASIGLVCKSERDTRQLFGDLSDRMDLSLLVGGTNYNTRGIFIIPVYMAKGLEFDAALVCDTDEAHYTTQDDRHLLYVACTRALHRLNLFYCGNPSPLLKEGS